MKVKTEIIASEGFQPYRLVIEVDSLLHQTIKKSLQGNPTINHSKIIYAMNNSQR